MESVDHQTHPPFNTKLWFWLTVNRSSSANAQMYTYVYTKKKLNRLHKTENATMMLMTIVQCTCIKDFHFWHNNHMGCNQINCEYKSYNIMYSS